MENYKEIGHINTFLICFRGSQRKFIFQTENELINLLGHFNRYGIEYIKIYNPVRHNFQRQNIKIFVEQFKHNKYLKHIFKEITFFKKHLNK